MLLDGFANTPKLFHSLRAIPFAKSAQRLSAAAERCGKQATVAALWRWIGRFIKKESWLSNLVVRNKQLKELLLKTKLAQGSNKTSEVVTVIVTRFKKLYEQCPQGSVKGMKDVIADFEYLIETHLSSFVERGNEGQILQFIDEMLQTEHKFKAGATTLEVVRHPEKYISAMYKSNLSNLELEDLISHAAGSGNFRFDIKWTSYVDKSKTPVSVYVDTKNYTAASNIFRDLRQFKAYIRQISSFDQLRIVQQGGRGVEAEQIIRQLEKMIEKDAYNVFYTNEELWKSVGIDKWEKLKANCSAGKLLQHSKFKEMIRLTK